MPVTTAPDVHELALMLADDIEAVVAALGIDVRRREGRRLVCFAPWGGHAKPKLEIELTPIAGKWNDWNAGVFGDALGLVAATLAGKPEPKDKKALAEAIRWAKRYFGHDGPDFDRAAWAQRKAEATERQRLAQARAARELSRNRATAKGLWLAAAPLAEGDAAWTYLKGRQIDLALLPRQPRALRLAPAAPWTDLQTGDVGHVGPCLMAAMTLGDGGFGSLHRTWIDPGRPGEKADVPDGRPRRMWPASSGAAIRLWRGASGLSDREAQKAGLVEDLVLCEGIETGLSIALMTPELRVYACGSLPGLRAFAPPKFVRRLIVAAENDWTKPKAMEQLDLACRRFTEEFGKPVSLARSPEGNDFNDLLRG